MRASYRWERVWMVRELSGLNRLLIRLVVIDEGVLKC
jgi:hypothetical protein